MALSNRGALSSFDASFKFAARASALVAGEPCHGQPYAWNQDHLKGISCLIRSEWSLRRLDVCICTDASGKGSAFAVREGRRVLASEVGTGFKRSSGSIRAESRALSSRQMSVRTFQVRTRMRCFLPERRVARTSLRFRYNFWIPRNGSWRRAVVSLGRKTSKSLKHVPSFVPSGMRRVFMRWDAF